MDYDLTHNVEAKLEKTLSITMQRRFYKLFGGIVKLSGRYEYLYSWRELVLIIDKEYWDANTRETYSIDMRIHELLRLMDESIRTGENRLFNVVQMQNGIHQKKDYLFDVVKDENEKAYIKEEKRGIKEIIKLILKKVVCI